AARAPRPPRPRGRSPPPATVACAARPPSGRPRGAAWLVATSCGAWCRNPPAGERSDRRRRRRVARVAPQARVPLAARFGVEPQPMAHDGWTTYPEGSKPPQNVLDLAAQVESDGGHVL